MSDPADTPGQNLAQGLRKDPVRRNCMSGRAVRYEKQEKTDSFLHSRSERTHISSARGCSDLATICGPMTASDANARRRRVRSYLIQASTSGEKVPAWKI